jgi:hypothetical protein
VLAPGPLLPLRGRLGFSAGPNSDPALARGQARPAEAPAADAALPARPAPLLTRAVASAWGTGGAGPADRLPTGRVAHHAPPCQALGRAARPPPRRCRSGGPARRAVGDGGGPGRGVMAGAVDSVAAAAKTVTRTLHKVLYCSVSHKAIFYKQTANKQKYRGPKFRVHQHANRSCSCTKLTNKLALLKSQ